MHKCLLSKGSSSDPKFNSDTFNDNIKKAIKNSMHKCLLFMDTSLDPNFNFDTFKNKLMQLGVNNL